MLRKIEWGFAIGATASVIALHVLFFLSAGPLWRDEVTSVNVASSGTWGDLWKNLEYDSFPAAWTAILRVWIASGAGASDLGLRALGLGFGLAVVALTWWIARVFDRGVPLLSIALFGFNASVIVFGDSVRAYGLGMATALACLGCVYRAAREPTLVNGILATTTAVAAVHGLFHNVVLVAAACAGAAAVLGRREGWRRLWIPAAIGAVPAASLLVYLEMTRRMAAWNAIVKFPIGFDWMWTKYLEAMKTSGPASHAIWIAVAAGAIATGFVLALSRRPSEPARREADLYAATVLAVGIVSYVAFLKGLRYLMQPWYFLVLMALVAAASDAILGRAGIGERLRVARLAGAALIIALAAVPVSEAVRARRTNLDRIAATLERIAVAGDLVVVVPWHYGITFDRYYRGPARWLTVPPVGSHKVHRYDLLKQAMMSPNAMGPVFDAIAAALRSGHRVFWVGGLEIPSETQPPPLLPPAPTAPWGWAEPEHYEGWIRQAGWVLRQFGRGGRTLPLEDLGPVSWLEDLQLHVILPAVDAAGP